MSDRAKSPVQVETGEYRQLPPADHRVRRVIQAIETDPACDIQGLARMVNLSTSRLSHLLKTATGSSLQSFLSTWRLERAAELLHSTEMPVKEVSYRVGYRHAPSFVRAFGSKFGSSPTDYRSRQRVVVLRDS